jgi:H+/Cl- antiporter ClcA
MAGMVSGVTGAALTSVVIILEITHCFNMALPIMITVFSASIVRWFFVKDSIYHSKLNKKIAQDILMLKMKNTED